MNYIKGYFTRQICYTLLNLNHPNGRNVNSINKNSSRSDADAVFPYDLRSVSMLHPLER